MSVIGNQNAVKSKPWSEALRSALIRYADSEVERGQALATIATVVVKKALAGDNFSIDEIANRLDGKPRQEVDATVDGTLEVRIIRFTEARLIEHEPELIGVAHGQDQAVGIIQR